MALGGSLVERPAIKVFGMFGSFTVGAQTSQAVTVRYFSTVASGSHSSSSGDSLGLLRELKPMRERVRVSDLRDLASLLQRELDDARVAKDLVPYLMGANSPVGFFPGILVALVPHGFLMADEGIHYPSAGAEQSTDDKVVTPYGAFWSATRFKLDGHPVALGRLDIDPAVTDLIVLDGQHRANAFRFVTKTFDVVQTEDSIYRAFYDEVAPPEAFASELPVTIVWFESADPIEPRLISRKLFVDVNTNAKPVSESRNVLLDDRARSSILTGSLYRLLAREAFDSDKFSLLHAGFDCEEKQSHALTLLLPSVAQYALAYTGFAKDEALGLSYTIGADWWRWANNYARLRSVSGEVGEGDFRAAEAGDRDAFDRVSTVLDERVSPRLLEIIEQFPLTKAHVAACVQLNAWIQGQAVMLKEVWDKVFRGGEGLYGGFARDDLGERAANYQRAIKEIEDKFVALREAELPGCSAEQVKRAYETFATKANFTGLLMAAHSFCEGHPDGWAASSQFVEALGRLSAVQWVKVLADYKPLVVRELKPALWPTIRNIYLRVVQSVAPEQSFFSASLAQAENPDVRVVRKIVDAIVDSHLNTVAADEAQVRPEPDRVRAWCEDAVGTLKNVLAGAGLSLVTAESVLIADVLARVEIRLPIATVLIPANAGDYPEDEPEPEVEPGQE